MNESEDEKFRRQNRQDDVIMITVVLCAVAFIAIMEGWLF